MDSIQSLRKERLGDRVAATLVLESNDSECMKIFGKANGGNAMKSDTFDKYAKTGLPLLEDLKLDKLTKGGSATSPLESDTEGGFKLKEGSDGPWSSQGAEILCLEMVETSSVFSKEGSGESERRESSIFINENCNPLFSAVTKKPKKCDGKFTASLINGKIYLEEGGKYSEFNEEKNKMAASIKRLSKEPSRQSGTCIDSGDKFLHKQLCMEQEESTKKEGQAPCFEKQEIGPLKLDRECGKDCMVVGPSVMTESSFREVSLAAAVEIDKGGCTQASVAILSPEIDDSGGNKISLLDKMPEISESSSSKMSLATDFPESARKGCLGVSRETYFSEISERSCSQGTLAVDFHDNGEIRCSKVSLPSSVRKIAESYCCKASLPIHASKIAESTSSKVSLPIDASEIAESINGKVLLPINALEIAKNASSKISLPIDVLENAESASNKAYLSIDAFEIPESASSKVSFPNDALKMAESSSNKISLPNDSSEIAENFGSKVSLPIDIPEIDENARGKVLSPIEPAEIAEGGNGQVTLQVGSREIDERRCKRTSLGVAPPDIAENVRKEETSLLVDSPHKYFLFNLPLRCRYIFRAMIKLRRVLISQGKCRKTRVDHPDGLHAEPKDAYDQALFFYLNDRRLAKYCLKQAFRACKVCRNSGMDRCVAFRALYEAYDVIDRLIEFLGIICSYHVSTILRSSWLIIIVGSELENLHHLIFSWWDLTLSFDEHGIFRETYGLYNF